MRRAPAVAGSFYPAGASELRRTLEELLLPHPAAPAAAPLKAKGLLAPHAGYVYSGRVAGKLFSRVEIPERVVVISPNHTGRGARFALWPEGSWQTPLGEVFVDAEAAGAILTRSKLVAADTLAHQREHSLEVELPFIQVRNSRARIIPLTIASHNLKELRELAAAIAGAISSLAGESLVLASSDMTHFEAQAEAERKDRLAMERVLALDEEGLLEVVARGAISMCGAGPVAAMLAATKSLGAESAELVGYETSGDVTGDRSEVVGYAAVIVK